MIDKKALLQLILQELKQQGTCAERLIGENINKTTHKKHQIATGFSLTENALDDMYVFYSFLAQELCGYLKKVRCRVVIGDIRVKAKQEGYRRVTDVAICVDFYKYKGRPPKTTG